ncbi:MAG: SRPBCC domain-containing protein [Chitinophagales bacterium]|nr:SRPBCC domain-containing protein [Chitinophagales bacterium]
MNSYDWTRFTKRININAPLKTIYDAWTTQQGMESWFLRRSEFKKPDGSLRKEDEHIEAGDTYYWLWHGWPDSTREQMDIVSANGNDKLQFHFAELCLVTVTLSEFKNCTIAELTQENIPNDEEHIVKFHLGCMEGWTFYLANLKSIMEGGLDLRNKDVEIGGVINS